MLGAQLNTIHNLHYYLQLMQDLRDGLDAERFDAVVSEFHTNRARGVD